MLSKSGLSAVWTNGLLGVQKINYEQTSLSPSIIEKCDVSFKRYVQISVKKTVWLYTSMKEF
jgi:hypothetical protein